MIGCFEFSGKYSYRYRSSLFSAILCAQTRFSSIIMIRLKRQRLDERGGDNITAKGEAEPTEDPESAKYGNTRSLFVRSLSPSTTSDQLASFFSQSYPVKHATVVFDKATKQSKGFGFVSFVDAEDASLALTALSQAILDGRHIVLEFAQPRHREHGLEASTRIDSRPKKVLHKPQAPRSKLIVRNLPWSIKNESQLSRLFFSFGKILHADLPRKHSSLSPGFGFLVFRRHTSAEKALNTMNGKEVDGRKIAVDWAVEKGVWEGHGQSAEVESTSEPTEAPMADEQENGNESDSAIDEVDGHGEAIESQKVPTSEVDNRAESKDSTKSGNNRVRDYQSTIFVRNIPFTTNGERLRQQFTQFGLVRSALIVEDPTTGLSKGTGFVTFNDSSTAKSCLREAGTVFGASGTPATTRSSLLGDAMADSDGQFTMDGRALRISQAVDRMEAARLSAAEVKAHIEDKEDKRRLYLLNEGKLTAEDEAHNHISPGEAKLREASFKQRQSILTKDPRLHMSLTRLSIRNLPKSVTSKSLKSLAREAVVGFAAQVKAGTRHPLSREELRRGGKEMEDAEKSRRAKGKGIVKQAKVVYESPSGTKVATESEGNHSRGYGFIEYTSHRWALMGLRWLNGHFVDLWLNGHVVDLSNSSITGSSSGTKGERAKRLIVEFAIENSKVVERRGRMERSARQVLDDGGLAKPPQKGPPRRKTLQTPASPSSKHEGYKKFQISSSEDKGPNVVVGSTMPNGQTMIGRKRMARKKRKSG